MTNFLSFLASLVNDHNLKYRTVRVYASAISQTHDLVGSLPLGELPVVKKFMKGVFRRIPPEPKICHTWQVQTVLDYMSSMGPVEGLTLKLLSLKLALLLALTSAARAHELKALNLDFVTRKEESWKFQLASHVKTSRPGHKSRCFLFKAFPGDPQLCIIKTLTEYTKRTASLRKSSQLLVSFIAPFDAISTDSVSRWIRQMLSLAGIDLAFTSHSTRSAATSAAAEAGLPIEHILEAADWASAKTFEKYYHKPTEDKSDFALSILQSLPSQ